MAALGIIGCSSGGGSPNANSPSGALDPSTAPSDPLFPDENPDGSPPAPSDPSTAGETSDGGYPAATDPPPSATDDAGVPPDVSNGPIGTGWTEIHPQYTVDNPPGQTRYTISGNEIHYWLFNTDMSKFPGRDAGPRSEFHWHNDYSTGQAQFQADLKIDHDCAHANVMQIFGSPNRATAFMAWAMPGGLSYYNMQVIEPNVYDKWIRLNVVHDTATGLVDVYVGGQHRYQVKDHGATTHYFKNGIYHQPNMTPRCDVYYRDIRIFKK
jgi:hypothetical protein